MLIILLVILLVLSVGSYPCMALQPRLGLLPIRRTGLVLVILVILLLLGRI